VTTTNTEEAALFARVATLEKQLSEVVDNMITLAHAVENLFETFEALNKALEPVE
jgi:hypothetical protein